MDGSRVREVLRDLGTDFYARCEERMIWLIDEKVAAKLKANPDKTIAYYLREHGFEATAAVVEARNATSPEGPSRRRTPAPARDAKASAVRR